MAKTNIFTGSIVKIEGCRLTLDNGDCVVWNLNYSNEVGDAIKYVEMCSIRYQAGNIEEKKFYKQV